MNKYVSLGMAALCPETELDFRAVYTCSLRKKKGTKLYLALLLFFMYPEHNLGYNQLSTLSREIIHATGTNGRCLIVAPKGFVQFSTLFTESVCCMQIVFFFLVHVDLEWKY